MREKRGKLMKVIVVSHGSYARGLVDTAQMIAGEQEDLEAFGLEPEESVDTLREKIRESIEQTSEGEEVLILTDLFYGSPFNTVISLMSEYDLYHVTGINLPLMMEVVMGRYAEKSAQEVCKDLLKAAPETVKDVGDVVAKDKFRSKVIKEMAPQGLIIHVYGIDRATEKLKEAPSFDGERVIVIAESPLVFEELIKRGIKINQLNIGGMGIRGERKAVARRVACDTMEMEAIHELIKKHVHVYFQTVPTRSSEEAKKYIKE